MEETFKLLPPVSADVIRNCLVDRTVGTIRVLEVIDLAATEYPPSRYMPQCMP